jgi:hypothetical protein
MTSCRLFCLELKIQAFKSLSVLLFCVNKFSEKHICLKLVSNFFISHLDS